MSNQKSNLTNVLSVKTALKKLFFFLCLVSFLNSSAQEGVTNLVNSTASLGGAGTPNGGIFMAHTTTQDRVIVTSAGTSAFTVGTQDIDITVLSNSNTIVGHSVFGIANGTFTPKDVIVDQFGYVIIVGKIVVTGGGGYNRGFVLRMDLSNFSSRTFATYDINSSGNEPWFHQILELNLSGSLYGGNRQIAVLASATVSGGDRKDFVLLINQTTLALNSITKIDLGSGYISKAFSPGMEGFRTMTETDATNNSLAIAGSYSYLPSQPPTQYGIYIVEFTYSSGNLVLTNQQAFESGNYPQPEWVNVHDMIFRTNGFNNYPTFYVAGAKFTGGGPSNYEPCYLAYSFQAGLNYANTLNVVSPPQNLILGQTSSKMQLINSEILVGNNRGDFYTFNWSSGTAGYIKSVTNAFRPSAGQPFGDFTYDNANTLFYGVTQGAINSEMQVFTMLPNNTDACCFAVNNVSNTTLSCSLVSPTVSTSASGTNYSGTVSTLTPTINSETLCAYCASNTMSISGPDNVFCDNVEYTLEGCSHSSNGYWEIIGPLPGTTNCSTKIVSSTNSSVIINLFNNPPPPTLSAGQYKVRYIEDIVSETGCLDVLVEKTINFLPTFTGIVSMLDNPDCDDDFGVFELTNPQGVPITSYSWTSIPNGTPVNSTVNQVTIDYTGYYGSFTVSVTFYVGGCATPVTKTLNFTRQACCSTSGTYQTVQQSYEHNYTGKTMGGLVDGQDNIWVLQDIGNQEFSLSQIDDVGKILQSHKYKGTSNDNFKVADFTNALYSNTTLGVIVAGSKGNKLYVVETDGSGNVIKKRAFKISSCESCELEVVNIDWTSNEFAKYGIAILLNLKNTSTGSNSVYLVHLWHWNLGMMWAKKLTFSESNATFVAHRLVTTLTNTEATIFHILGTVIIDGVKKGIIMDPFIDVTWGYNYPNPRYRISDNVYFDGRGIRNPSDGTISGFVFGGSTDASAFNYTANATFLKTDVNLNTVYEKKISGYHMHALNAIPANGNYQNTVFLLQSRHYFNTGHYYYHLIELDGSLNIVGGTVETLLQYKNTSNNHTPYSAGKKLVIKSSDGGYVFVGHDENEYDFTVAKVEPDFDGSCSNSFSVSTTNNVNDSYGEGLTSIPDTVGYALSVDEEELPLEYICCESRNGATFTLSDIMDPLPEVSVRPLNNSKKDGVNRSDFKGNSLVNPFENPSITDFNIQILPNPSSGIFSINMYNQNFNLQINPEYSITVMDLTGKVVYIRTGLHVNSNEIFDLSSMSSGVYTVQIKLGDSYQYLRIIKN